MTAADTDDVEVALGRTLTDLEKSRAGWWLTGIELIIAKHLPLAELDQEALKYVEAEAVAAKVDRASRPESSITVSGDDASVTRRYDQPATSSDITNEWWDLLTPTERGAFTIRPARSRRSRAPGAAS